MISEARLVAGTATGVGSLPHTDPQAAASLVLRLLPELPALPELPKRDPRTGGDGVLRPGMVLMEDLRLRHSTLLKIERRVHSPDYVPADFFAENAR